MLELIFTLISEVAIILAFLLTAIEMHRRTIRRTRLGMALMSREWLFVVVFVYIAIAGLVPVGAWWAVIIAINVILWRYLYVLRTTPRPLRLEDPLEEPEGTGD